jgi:hypothetical protein
MAVTKEDLRDFTRFADERIQNGGAESLVKLAGEWEAKRGVSEVTLNVQNGLPSRFRTCAIKSACNKRSLVAVVSLRQNS